MADIQRYAPVDIKSHDHFLGCNSPLRIKWHLELISAVGQQLDMMKTNEDLKDTIINALDCALAGRLISVNRPFSEALPAQELIGWQAMLQGYWASEWQTAFQHMFSPPNKEIPEDKSR
jgi:hypothetical protein